MDEMLVQLFQRVMKMSRYEGSESRFQSQTSGIKKNWASELEPWSKAPLSEKETITREVGFAMVPISLTLFTPIGSTVIPV